MARRSKVRRDGLARRILRVLRWLDAEPDAERVAEYRALAVAEHGSLEAGIEADERAMSEEGIGAESVPASRGEPRPVSPREATRLGPSSRDS